MNEGGTFPLWGKISIALTLLPLLWRLLSAIFGLVTRKELLEALQGQERRHKELMEWLQRVDGRVGQLEQEVAQLRGEMSGRHKALMEEGS